jgi:hypothetical protein
MKIQNDGNFLPVGDKEGKLNLMKYKDGGKISIYGIGTNDWNLKSAKKPLAVLKLPPAQAGITHYYVQSGQMMLKGGRVRIHLPVVQTSEIIRNVFKVLILG